MAKTRNADAEAEVEQEATEAVEGAQTRSRDIEDLDEAPVGLRGTGGGRSRTPTEFDDKIAVWNNGKLKKIPVDDADDARYVFNAIKRAVDFYNEQNPDNPLGAERTPAVKGEDGKLKAVDLKDGNPTFIVVKVRPKQKRGPEVGSARIELSDGTRKVFGPGEWYEDDEGNKVPTDEALAKLNGSKETVDA